MGHAKHATSKNNKILKKIIIVLIIVIVISLIAIAGYFSYNYFNCNNVVDNSSEEYYTETTSNTIDETLTVNGADYLEITGLYIDNSNPELSTISAQIKNISNQVCENINLRINLLDENDEVITFLDYNIEKIDPDSESYTYAALKCDLSNCVNYSISLKK